MSNITAGFRCTGVYPLDCSVILTHPTVSSENEKYKLPAEKTGLRFIPLYSPSRMRVESKTQVPLFNREQIHNSLPEEV